MDMGKGMHALTRFIAVHSMPWSEEEVVEGAKSMASQLPEGLTWKATYCGYDGKFFCE